MLTATDRNKALYIGELFKRVFDVQLPIYFPYGKAEYYTAKEYPDIEFYEEKEIELNSWMGTPVINSFSFEGGSYKTYDLMGQIIDIEMSDFVMPYATLVDFEQVKNITQTRIVGNFGTVKELYGFDDWQIDIRGFCLTDETRPNEKTAKQQIDILNLWGTLASSIKVNGKPFIDKDITNIVIQSVKIRAIQGKPDVISFEIDAISDQPIELIDL